VVASATRDNRRLIAVVLGEPSGRDRNLRAAGLLDHGFETAEWKAHFGAPTIDSLPVDAQAKEVASVRSTVVAWDCGGRKPARKVARRKPPATTARKTTQGTKAAEATGAGVGSTEASPGAARPPKAAAAPTPRRAAPAKE
jgi:D-alanyl-D-alanine carboxypeptidase